MTNTPEKTREEFLKKNGIYPGFRSTYTYDGILIAMREYSDSQLKEKVEVLISKYESMLTPEKTDKEQALLGMILSDLRG